MDASSVAARVAGIACGGVMVLSCVIVVLRLEVVRASRLAVVAWGCASAERDAQSPKVSAQMERTRAVLPPARGASPPTPLTSMMRAFMTGSARELTVVRIRVARMQCVDREGNLSRLLETTYSTMVSLDT